MTINILDILLSQLEPVSCSMSGSNCCFLICIQVSQETGKVVWYSISLRIFQFVVIHTVKDCSIVNEVEVDFFLVFPCFFYDPMDVGNLIWSLCLFSIQLVYLEVLSSHTVEAYLEGFWTLLCVVVWTFFGMALFRDCSEYWLFQSYGHCWLFQIFQHIEFSTLTAPSFRILNNSAGIPSPPLALFVVMRPKAQLTSQSRVSGSRWVIIPWWLPGSLRPF